MYDSLSSNTCDKILCSFSPWGKQQFNSSLFFSPEKNLENFPSASALFTNSMMMTQRDFISATRLILLNGRNGEGNDENGCFFIFLLECNFHWNDNFLSASLFTIHNSIRKEMKKQISNWKSSLWNGEKLFTFYSWLLFTFNWFVQAHKNMKNLQLKHFLRCELGSCPRPRRWTLSIGK